MLSKKTQLKIKRVFDVVVSLIVIVPFFPLWLVLSLAIKMSSKGPVFFLQDRPGLYGTIFKVFKFRTMKPGSEKMIKGVEVTQDDDRITSIGKILRRTKVDEVPQVINVLKGEMSLIGPRPERVSSLEEYNEEISKRLNMKPGMTGLAQVSGNIYLTLDERYKLDVYYVENFSLWKDLKIIFRTVGVVIFGEDKYVNKKLVNINQARNRSTTGKEII